jgi:prepilin-type N-terminal cleavage/methylation domain-containing protein
MYKKIYASHFMKYSGFTLMELAIVLVIMGLIAGSIVSGSAMIRASELRTITTDYEFYKTSVGNFKVKYFGLPGDITDATDYWGAAPACPAAGTSTQTCNGDGDGIIDQNSGSSHEIYRFWQHLKNAEMVSGTYNGVNGTTQPVAWNSVIGANVEASKVKGACFGADQVWDNSAPSGTPHYNINYSNRMNFGSTNEGLNNCDAAALTPEEVWNIDTKMDDGVPTRGEVIVSRKDCGTTTVATTAEYDLSEAKNTRLCGIIFQPMW